MNRNPEAAGWKITADPRGTLVIPGADHDVRIPCGTIDIDNHLQGVAAEDGLHEVELDDVLIHTEWPSLRGGQRYQGVLYIEKEGFGPLLKEARIAERFDLAVLSCKGQSVVAARKFVDHVCYRGSGVPLFVVHDFDKSGFEIAQRLTRVSDWARGADRVTYEFVNDIEVYDLGLRLDDAEQYGLESEPCDFKGGFASDSICTPVEREYLMGGQRIELNAFTSPDFVAWLESKLGEHLPKRLIPSEDVLAAAYRCALVVAKVNDAIEEVLDEAIDESGELKIPKTLKRQLTKAMKDDPVSWDTALYRLVKSKLYPDSGE